MTDFKLLTCNPDGVIVQAGENLEINFSKVGGLIVLNQETGESKSYLGWDDFKVNRKGANLYDVQLITHSSKILDKDLAFIEIRDFMLRNCNVFDFHGEFLTIENYVHMTLYEYLKQFPNPEQMYCKTCGGETDGGLDHHCTLFPTEKEAARVRLLKFAKMTDFELMEKHNMEKFKAARFGIKSTPCLACNKVGGLEAHQPEFFHKVENGESRFHADLPFECHFCLEVAHYHTTSLLPMTKESRSNLIDKFMK